MTTVLCHTQMMAQDKIVNPEISYAGSQRTMTIGGLAVNGIEGHRVKHLGSEGVTLTGAQHNASVLFTVQPFRDASVCHGHTT